MPRPSEHWKEYRRSRGKGPAIVKALSRINFEELCNLASHLNPEGNGCHVDQSTYAFGGENIVFELCFKSGEVWIARLRFPEDSANEVNDTVLESEAVTMRFLCAMTTIPVPVVYGYDARYGNSIGLPYILMEAMPGKRLWGGGRADLIPDQHKDKVYRQIADILLQLYAHPFEAIGMLFPAETDLGVRVGPIFDGSRRIDSYGPFTTAIDFYRQRSILLNKYRQSTGNIDLEADTEFVVSFKYEPEAAEIIVDPDYNSGPFRLSHPDFTINNFLFDDDYNITALLDWCRCQTVPMESFAKIPERIVPEADRFLDGYELPEELRSKWKLRRCKFLEVLRECELQRFETTEIADMMESPRSYFATCLDMYGILGISFALPRKEFDEFQSQLETFSK